jgi:uncharacterized protein YjbI with pentapeptide repeats
LSDNAALIGALVALGGVFTTQLVNSALEDQRTQESRNIEDQRIQESRNIEDQRTQEARNLEAQRAHEAALQNYFEQVGKLLVEHPLREANPYHNLSVVVRAQTLTVLEGLEPHRKRILLQFLYEAELIQENKPVVSLFSADLSEADLSEADLSGAYLPGVNLRRANLSKTNLVKANLSGANLTGANLSRTLLMAADMSKVRGITNEQLEQATSLLTRATIMPDGSKYQP